MSARRKFPRRTVGEVAQGWLDELRERDEMAKNVLQVSIQVRDLKYMPNRDKAVEWLTEQYDNAVELAEQTPDGTVTTVKQSFPCKEIPKE